LSKLGGEIRDPERNVPRALLLGLATVTLIYLLTSAVFLYLVPLDRVASSETFAAQAGSVLLGRLGGRIFAGVVVFSVLGSMAGYMMTAPRVYYSMAQDGLFFASLAKVHPRWHTPARAIAVQAGLASALIAIGTFGEIISYFLFVTVGFLALTVAGLFLLRRPANAGRRAYGYPVTPILFLTMAALTALLLLLQDARHALIGVAVLGIGALVYQLVLRPRRVVTDRR
jgi:APA family basic amino acid/polyamine antiporter